MSHSLDAPFGEGEGRSFLVLIFGLACIFKKSTCLFLHSFYKLWHASGINPEYSLFTSVEECITSIL